MYQWELGLVVAVLLIHGLGHGLGLFPVFGWARAPNWSNRSWLVGNSGTAKVLALLIWSTAIAAFVGAALGLLGWTALFGIWRQLAFAGAIISLAGLVLFWQAFPATFNKLGAALVDLLVLYGLLVARWFPMVGSR